MSSAETNTIGTTGMKPKTLVPLEVRADVQFVFVRTMEEVLDAAFGKGVLNWRGDVVVSAMESRL